MSVHTSKIILAILCFTVTGCAMLGVSKGAKDASASFQEEIGDAERLYAEGNFVEAKKLLIKVNTESASKDANVLYRLGTIAFKESDINLAAEYFESAIKQNPRSPKAHFNLATIRLMQAEEHFKYYVATVDPKADINDISTLIGAIESYASSRGEQ